MKDRCYTAKCKQPVVFEMENEKGIVFACTRHQRDIMKLMEMRLLEVA